MRAMPVFDARIASQVTWVPIPNGVTSPTPVTTTLRDKTLLPGPDQPLLFAGLAFDVFHRVLHSRDLLGVFIGDLELECFLKSHYKLDDVERIGAQVVNERCVAIDLAFIDAQLLDNNLLHLLL